MESLLEKSMFDKFSNLKSYQQQKIVDFLQRFSVINLIDTNFIANKDMYCRKCSSTLFVKNGTFTRKESAKKIQRYKCKQCGCTQFGDANTALYNLKKKDKWTDYVYLMLDKAIPLSAVSISKSIDVSNRTGFRWRHKFLSSLNQSKPFSSEEEQEIDEVYFRFCVKGTIGKEKFETYIAPGHPDNIENKLRKKEKRMQAESHQAIFLCRHNRMGDFDFNPIKTLKKGLVSEADLKRVMKDFDLSKKTILTDKESSMCAYMNTLEDVNHLTFRSSDIKKGILENKNVHNNNINSMMSRLNNWFKFFHGVSTKYLENYLKWFRFKNLFKSFKIKQMLEYSLTDRESYPRFQNLFKTYEIFVYI